MFHQLTGKMEHTSEEEYATPCGRYVGAHKEWITHPATQLSQE
jgi:hypothetical protein